MIEPVKIHFTYFFVSAEFANKKRSPLTSDGLRFSKLGGKN
jgi:hypothetical protein